MLSPKQMAAATTALCDQVAALVRDHERDFHDGERCQAIRIALVAALAASLGVVVLGSGDGEGEP